MSEPRDLPADLYDKVVEAAWRASHDPEFLAWLAWLPERAARYRALKERGICPGCGEPGDHESEWHDDGSGILGSGIFWCPSRGWSQPLWMDSPE